MGAIRQKPYPMAPTSEHSAVVDSLRHPGLYTRIRAGPDPFAIKKAPSGRDRYGPPRQEVAGRPLPSTGKRAMEVWPWRTLAPARDKYCSFVVRTYYDEPKSCSIRSSYDAGPVSVGHVLAGEKPHLNLIRPAFRLSSNSRTGLNFADFFVISAKFR